MDDQWVKQLQELNGRLRAAFSADRLGDPDQRRWILSAGVGPIRLLERLSGDKLAAVLNGRPLVGVDGSPNMFGRQYPYYIELMRALAKPSSGEPIILKDIHCPVPVDEGADEEAALRNDNEIRQKKLADLEVRAALAALDQLKPAVLLMDGPLVRFAMRTKESFSFLRKKALSENVLLIGCIENIESRVLVSVLGDQAPPGWRNRLDGDLLWGMLEYGEVLEVARAAKGTAPMGNDPGRGEEMPIRTWFMRAARDPGVVGLDMLDEQVSAMGPIADYLFTLSPADGRGIPIWLDIVDREVRLTHGEMEAYAQLLEPQIQRVFASKRDARFF